MTGRTHDLAAFTALNLIVVSQSLPQLSLATALVSLGVCFIGGLAPDIDTATSEFWQKFPAGTFVGRVLHPLLGGHRLISHSLLGLVIFGFVVNYLLTLAGKTLLVNMEIVWWAFMIGVLSHLIADTFTEEGVPWFFPIPVRFGIPPISALRIRTGGLLEKILVFLDCYFLIFTFFTLIIRSMLTFSVSSSSKLIILPVLLIICLIIPKPVFAQNWQYPLNQTLDRPSYKTFGQYFDLQSYIGKESLFPVKFTGFHTGSDLEISPEAENITVPVYAITDGTISFIGPVTGYGGLILEKLDSENLTVLYGHLNLSTTNLKVGDSVYTGRTLAVLGDAFSSQTGGERKHLHLGIYKGTALYFKGYENTKSELDAKWIDPLKFLESKIAVVPSPTQLLTPTTIKPPNSPLNFFSSLLDYFGKINLWQWLHF